MLCALRVAAQPATAPPPQPGTLRAELQRSGFDAGIRTDHAPDLDRRLTSYALGTSVDTFVAGYYYEDELEGQRLGPLHVSLFDRSRRQWVTRHNVTASVAGLGQVAAGSVLGVTVHPQLVVLETHVNPSASFLFVLDRSLRILTSLEGYRPRLTNDGSLWYFGNMVHFAPMHQETLRFFDAGRRADVEVFPGARLSAVAGDFKKQIDALRAALPADQRAADFDRGLSVVAERESKRFAFIADYNSDYLDAIGVAHPTLTTMVRCARESAGEWSCSERELTQFVRESGQRLSRDANGNYETRTLEALVKAALDGKQ